MIRERRYGSGWFVRPISVLLAIALFFACICPAGAEYIFLPEAIQAEAAILIDAKTGAYLFEKNADRAMYPASTTKIMTCILALEYGHLNDIVTIPAEAANVPKDSSKIPVTVGEQMSFIDLIYGMMIMSGNDGANAIAVIVGGSLSKFVSMMNRKASELGMKNTHFSNAHGYHEDSHYTTARDMSRLAFYCMQNETFRQIVSTQGYIIGPTNKRDTNLKLVSTNLMLVQGSDYYYQGCTGVKTGYTRSARQTYVCSAEKNGAQIIAVLMKSGTSSDDSQRWVDAAALLDYGFSRYRFYDLNQLYSMAPVSVSISGASEQDIHSGELGLTLINLSGSYTAACLDGNTADALKDFTDNREVSISADLTAPIEAGTIIGSLSYITPEGIRITGTLVAERTVEEQPEVASAADFLPFLKDIDTETAIRILKIGGGVLAAIVVIHLFRSAALKRRRRKARRSRKKKGAYYSKNNTRTRYYN